MTEEDKLDFFELTFRNAILDSLSANIAVIDVHGEILAVNASWQAFAEANEMGNSAHGIGANYLRVCRSAGVDPNARAALEGILDVIKGRRSTFYHEYPCHSPEKQRWFALRVTPLVDFPHFVVVSHEDITDKR
ncbi:MAG: PAS domain-containing protein [Woeseiaceae bacterium]